MLRLRETNLVVKSLSILIMLFAKNIPSQILMIFIKETQGLIEKTTLMIESTSRELKKNLCVAIKNLTLVGLRATKIKAINSIKYKVGDR